MDDQSDALIRKLVRQLHDADPVARRNAAGALRLHGERAACTISELRELLTDKDTRVRAEARRALNRLRQPAA
jgi:HEAT repeat protein